MRAVVAGRLKYLYLHTYTHALIYAHTPHMHILEIINSYLRSPVPFHVLRVLFCLLLFRICVSFLPLWDLQLPGTSIHLFNSFSIFPYYYNKQISKMSSGFTCNSFLAPTLSRLRVCSQIFVHKCLGFLLSWALSFLFLPSVWLWYSFEVQLDSFVLFCFITSPMGDRWTVHASNCATLRKSISHAVFWARLHNINLILRKHQNNVKWGTLFFYTYRITFSFEFGILEREKERT